MPKWILYIVIVLLLALLGYLLVEKGQHSDVQPNISSDIEFSPTEVTSTSATTTPAPSEEEGESETLLAISGTLVRFDEVPVRTTGELIIYALVNDGTEIITIDMQNVVSPGVSAPEDQLGLKLGQTVTVRGEIVDGIFTAVEIE